MIKSRILIQTLNFDSSMEPKPTVFDISSDEEPAFNDPVVGDDDYRWLTDFLVSGDDHVDDSDDVVVVGEYNPQARAKSKSKSTEPVKGVIDGSDDDDCEVLEGDPDCPVTVEKDAGSNDDDLLVVGQKGQIACRDYPHPRHHCAKYPFSATPHAKHCDLCHCYVCDSIAPCKHWGTGVSNIDHCHATDKESMWKTQRESLRQGKFAPPLVSKSPDIPLPPGLHQLNQVASNNIIGVAPNSMPQNQLCRPSTLCAYSSNTSDPNNIIQGRYQQSAYVPVQNGFLPCSVSPQPLGPHRDVVLRQNRGCNTRKIGQRPVPSNTMFKRPGIIRGSSAVNQSVYGSLGNLTGASASENEMKAGNLATSNDRSSTGQQDVDMNLESYIYSVTNMGSSMVNTVPSQSAACSQPVGPIHWSSGNQNIYQHGNQTGNVTNPEFSDFDFGCLLNNVSQSNWPTTVEDIQLHGLGSNDEQLAVQQLNTQFTGSPQLHPTDTHYTDTHYESWIVGHSDPLASEGYMPMEQNLISPQPPAIDTGMFLFDFETSWDSLTHA